MFLRNHASASWACDFLPVTDVFFRPLFACFVTALASRHAHRAATRDPTDARVAQLLREAIAFVQCPQYLIRDNDSTFRAAFARVAAADGIAILRPPCRACLDHVLILGERQLGRVPREYVAFFNRARPHRGLNRAVPEPLPGESVRCAGRIRAVPVLGGLHHTYRRAA